MKVIYYIVIYLNCVQYNRRYQQFDFVPYWGQLCINLLAQLASFQTLLAGPKSQLASLETQLAGSQTWLEGPQTQFHLSQRFKSSPFKTKSHLHIFNLTLLFRSSKTYVFLVNSTHKRDGLASLLHHLVHILKLLRFIIIGIFLPLDFILLNAVVCIRILRLFRRCCSVVLRPRRSSSAVVRFSRRRGESLQSERN